MKISRQELGVHILRLGLSIVFLWFGFSQLIDSLKWVSIVPDWAVNLLNLPPAMIVMANGLFEIVLGTLMAMNFFVRIIAFVFAVHLVPIALSLGMSPSAVRDFGLIVAAFSLFMIYTKNIAGPKIEV